MISRHSKKTWQEEMTRRNDEKKRREETARRYSKKTRQGDTVSLYQIFSFVCCFVCFLLELVTCDFV